MYRATEKNSTLSHTSGCADAIDITDPPGRSSRPSPPRGRMMNVLTSIHHHPSPRTVKGISHEILLAFAQKVCVVRLPASKSPAPCHPQLITAQLRPFSHKASLRAAHLVNRLVSAADVSAREQAELSKMSRVTSRVPAAELCSSDKPCTSAGRIGLRSLPGCRSIRPSRAVT